MNALNFPNADQAIRIELTVLIFQEGDYYVAYCPSLELSSYGDSIDDAKSAFDEVVEGWLNDAKENGTLHDDLVEHGWSFKKLQVPTPPNNIELNIPGGALRRQINENYLVTV